MRDLSIGRALDLQEMIGVPQHLRYPMATHCDWDGRFKSDICMVCCRLPARVRIKHRTFALLMHASNLIQERLFRPRHTIRMSDLIHAAASNGMGSLSQTFSRCAAGSSLEAGFNVQLELSIRFEYFFFRNACFDRGTPYTRPT